MAFGGPEEEHDADDDADQGRYLGVGHTPVNAGVDADELDEEAADAGEDEVEAGEPADGFMADAWFGRTEFPDDPEDDDGEEEFVDGGGLDEGVGGSGGDEGAGVGGEAVGEVERPRGGWC